MNTGYENANNILNIAELETEVKLLREQLQDEKIRREQSFYENHQLFTQLHTQIHQQESEIIKRIKEHREDQMLMLNANTDEKTLIERMKQEKVDNDLGFIRGMISTLDKKIDDESTFRLRSEDDIRKWFEQKFTMTSERLDLGERGSLDRERRVMQQLQEGLTTLGEIIRSVKEQNSIGLNEVHTIAIENNNELTQKYEYLKEALMQRQNGIEMAFIEMKQQFELLNDQALQHAKTVNEALTKEVNRMERICSTLDRYISEQLLELRQTVQNNQSNFEKWKANIEDTEAGKLLEIHSAMKILNTNFQKISQDNKDRFELLQNEFLNLDNAVKEQVQDIRHKIELDMQTIEERMMMLIDKTYIKQSVGASSNSQLVLPERQPTHVSGNYQDQIGQIKEELKQYLDIVIFQNNEKLLEQKHKSEILVEGRANQYSVDLEKKQKDMIKQFQSDIQVQESENRVRIKEQIDQINDSVNKIKGESQKNQRDNEEKQYEIKKWVENSLKASLLELTNVVDKKLIENEVVIRKAFLKGGNNSENLKSNELQALKEKNMLDYVDTMIKNVKHELSTEIEEEKSRKNHRFDQVTNLIQTHKNLLDEHITQQGESLKALLKANLNEESAQRHRENEKIIASTDKRLTAIEKLTEARLGEEVGKLILRIDTNKLEFIDIRDNHENRLKLLQEKQNQVNENIESLSKKVNDKLQKIEEQSQKDKETKQREAEVKQIMDDILNQLEGKQEKEKEKTIEERISNLEIKEVMNEILNKVSANYMDSKFETSILDIVKNLQTYIGIVNNTSSQQYQDFNKNLKESFGQNLQQIQDTIQNMSEELLAAKSQLTEVTNKIEDVDIKSRLGIAELSDRVEIERLVNDLVSWVCEKET